MYYTNVFVSLQFVLYLPVICNKQHILCIISSIHPFSSKSASSCPLAPDDASMANIPHGPTRLMLSFAPAARDHLYFLIQVFVFSCISFTQVLAKFHKFLFKVYKDLQGKTALKVIFFLILLIVLKVQALSL